MMFRIFRKKEPAAVVPIKGQSMQVATGPVANIQVAARSRVRIDALNGKIERINNHYAAGDISPERRDEAIAEATKAINLHKARLQLAELEIDA